MQKLKIAAFILASLLLAAAASAQTFEKKHHNYSEWTKGRFSEAVTVTGPGKMINQLASPGMMVEIDVTAIVPLK